VHGIKGNCETRFENGFESPPMTSVPRFSPGTESKIDWTKFSR
jgi:hypothetical protein